MLPNVFFAQPDKLPAPYELGDKVVVLDVSFALPVAPGEYPLDHPLTREHYRHELEGTTLKFIKELGARLLLWVDHHAHTGWPRFRDDRRFCLKSGAQYLACTLLVTPELFALPGVEQADTLVCHPDLDGLLSAARFILRGKLPYPRAAQDAIAADTRCGHLSDRGQLMDQAIKARPGRDTCQAVLNWLVRQDQESRRVVEQAAQAYVQLSVPSGRAWTVGDCRVQDARTDNKPFDRTRALQRLQSEGYFGVLLYRRDGVERLEIAGHQPDVRLPEWLGVPGGSNQRLMLNAEHLVEVVERVNRRAHTHHPLALPKRALVEITRRCNLRCPICPVGNGQARPMPDMEEETFHALIARFGAGLESLTLHNYGEPALHPRLTAFIRHAKQAGIPQVDLTTNGTIMTHKLAAELVASGLDAIRFSVDTSDPHAYAQYRLGGKLSRVLAHMARLRRVREDTGAAKPYIEAQALLMRHNEKAVADFERVMLEHGADGVRYKTLNIFMSGERMAESGIMLLPQNPGYHRYVSPHPLPAGNAGQILECHWPWDRLVVLSDGTIVPCCHDFNADYPLGQAGEGDWDNPQRRKFMLQRLLHPASFEMCRRCSEAVPEIGLRKEADLKCRIGAP